MRLRCQRVVPRLLFVLIVISFLFPDHVEASPQDEIPEIPKLLGVHATGFVDQSYIDGTLSVFDNWAGKRNSIVGIVSEIDNPDPTLDIHVQVNNLWLNGYTPLIKLNTGYFSQPSAAQIATGAYDEAIQRWVRSYAQWATNGKWAYIALLPDMNAPWISYSGDPANYIAAFQRIRQVFLAHGLDSGEVRFIFAPYGGIEFSEYFPGESAVDVLGVNLYHFGSCNQGGWYSPAEIIGNLLRQLTKLSPTTPIFVTQFATTAQFPTQGVVNHDKKDEWLLGAYSYLSSASHVRAVIYTNQNMDCDWAIFQPSGVQYSGYIQGISQPEFGYLTPAELGQTDLSIPYYPVFLPGVMRSHVNYDRELPILLGVYPNGWAGSPETIQNEILPMDFWAQKRLSIVGTFVSLNPLDYTTHVTKQLSLIWDSGYTPYANLMVNASAASVARGDYDSQIRLWAQAFLVFSDNGRRMAFLAPFPEMNGAWTPYGSDPANYIKAFLRIQEIFKTQGVPPESVRWVFAPNRFPKFLDYYPGNSNVDVISFSAYNFGNCPGANLGWETPENIYSSAIEKIMALAPTKPIFIGQTAVTAYAPNGYNPAAKDAWLFQAYMLMTTYPAVKGAIYFNLTKECDYRIYSPSGIEYQGYKNAVANPAFGYIDPVQLRSKQLQLSP